MEPFQVFSINKTPKNTNYHYTDKVSPSSRHIVPDRNLSETIFSKLAVASGAILTTASDKHHV